ncbi:serine protease [Haloferula sp. BvORR071]|uniref:S1 family peptidase n=1 Tax=Haloferula sp. BvORR071 TaxID=1396141 RepID=UPI00054E43B4|nr:serine protease [Haloferula sp. BvORR071]
MTGVPRLAIGLLGLALAQPMAADETADLKAENVRLHALVRQHATGMFFDEVKTKSGDATYRDVVIKQVTGKSVRFRHAGGEGEIAAADSPPLWTDLFGFEAAKESPAEKPKAEEPKPTMVSRSEVSPAEAIAVVEGDRSSGTGFFCRSGDQVYLYTAAHVISGNAKLQVKLRSGTVVRKFGDLEAAEGADLVRLPVQEQITNALEIAPESGLAKVDEEVLASGNAAGAGTVGFEKGKILGVGPTSIEIDAQVIQGNSGGPILDAASGRALGVVTHLTAGRDDRWAKDTRFSTIRRFGCRLDRSWEWKKVSVEGFLKEGKAVLAVQDQSELMIAALQPEQWKSEVFRRLATNPLARDITALDSWIEEQRQGGQRFSENDRKKRLRGVLDSARHRSKSQIASFNAGGFTWFHRDLADKEITKRDEIDKVYESTLLDLR